METCGAVFKGFPQEKPQCGFCPEFCFLVECGGVFVVPAGFSPGCAGLKVKTRGEN